MKVFVALGCIEQMLEGRSGTEVCIDGPDRA